MIFYKSSSILEEVKKSEALLLTRHVHIFISHTYIYLKKKLHPEVHFNKLNVFSQIKVCEVCNYFYCICIIVIIHIYNFL